MITASAIHGSRSASTSRITAASIISRSASGSATLPNSRLDVPAAREPAVDLVGHAGDAEDDRGRPAVAAVRGHEERRRRPGRATSRAIVSAFGSCCERRGNGAGGHDCKDNGAWPRPCSRSPGFVERALPRVPARALRGRTEGGDFWAWREAMLDVAAAQTPERVRREYAARLPRAARRRLHGRRRVPLPRPRRGARGRGGRRGGRDRARAALRGVRARRARPLPPGVRRGVPDARSRRCARRAFASASPPTPSAPARPTGSRRSAATPSARPLPLHVHADEQPREIEECLAEHGVRPIELLARTRLPRAADDGRPRDARGRARARPDRRRRRARLRLPDDGGEPRRRLRAGRRHLRARDRRSASARTRTSASTRSRSCASSRASRAGAAGRRNVISPASCSAFGSDEGAAALGLERVAGRRGRPLAPVARAASTRATCTPRSCSAARPRCWRRPRSRRAAAPSTTSGRGTRGRQRGRGGPRRRRRTGTRTRPAASSARRLDLRALVPLVVARDRDPVGAGVRSRPATSRRRSRRSRARLTRVSPVARARRSRARPTARRAARPRAPARRAARSAGAEVEDVVRVDAGEAGRRRARATSAVCASTLDARRARSSRSPSPRPAIVERVVDVERADPEPLQVVEVGGDARRPCGRRTARAGRRPARPCRAAPTRDHGGSRSVLGRAPAPPRADDLVDAGAVRSRASARGRRAGRGSSRRRAPGRSSRRGRSAGRARSGSSAGSRRRAPGVPYHG